MSYRNRKEGWTISSHWWVSTSNASHSVLRLMISDKLATMLTALDASKDLLLLDISTLSPPSPATLGCICAKFSQIMTTITQQWVLPGYERLSATYMWPLLKMIKSVLCLVSEYGWWFRILIFLGTKIFGLRQKLHNLVHCISYLHGMRLHFLESTKCCPYISM